MKKIVAFTLTSVLVGSLSFGTAFAFQDLEPENKEAVLALQERGVVSGIDSEHFAPKGKLSFAQSVQMLVKAFQLNIDNMRFIKEPLASDIYTSVPDDAWYANAFVIAHYNGLEIPKDVNPNASITREQFAHLLVTALEKKGNFPLIKIYIEIKDEEQITPDYQGAIQRLLIYKLAALDSEGRFNPKGELTRGQAASWVHHAIRKWEQLTEKPAPVEEITVSVDKINDDLNKITLSRGEKPNAGYGIVINGIRFGQDGQAVVTYTLTDPQPDRVYADVITVPQAITYVASNYKVTAEPSGNAVPLKP